MNIILEECGTGGGCEALSVVIGKRTFLITDGEGGQLPIKGQEFILGEFNDVGYQVWFTVSDNYSKNLGIKLIKERVKNESKI